VRRLSYRPTFYRDNYILPVECAGFLTTCHFLPVMSKYIPVHLVSKYTTLYAWIFTEENWLEWY